MKLDLLYEIDVPYPWPDKPHPYAQREAEQKAYADTIEQVKAADKLGFNAVWFVEHHFRENRSHCPSSEAVLGALSQVTENIRLGFGVTLLPHEFIHPVRVAEKVATVDVLSRGRVEWGMGRSTPMEQDAFGVDKEKSKEKMIAAAKTVVGMWGADFYEEHSEYLDFPRRMVTPKPFQDPHPPAWMACNSPESAEIAGRSGLGMVSFSPLQPIERTAAQIQEYRNAAANPQPITGVSTNKVAGYTLVHCAESMQQAEANGIWDAVSWWYRNLAEFIMDWEYPAFAPGESVSIEEAFPMMARPVEEFDQADMIIVGEPERCIEKLVRFAEAGVDQMMCYVQFGKLPHESVMRCLELLGTKVRPALEARFG
ncbi:LLM class flavin-dependent oxidoreductase [Myxococcota bacterium]|nr:LLM class flavin-dependent oxidoreductase [Myxococcota bacterium]